VSCIVHVPKSGEERRDGEAGVKGLGGQCAPAEVDNLQAWKRDKTHNRRGQVRLNLGENGWVEVAPPVRPFPSIFDERSRMALQHGLEILIGGKFVLPFCPCHDLEGSLFWDFEPFHPSCLAVSLSYELAV
jgi:hypothetical protein